MVLSVTPFLKILAFLTLIWLLLDNNKQITNTKSLTWIKRKSLESRTFGHFLTIFGVEVCRAGTQRQSAVHVKK